MEWLKVVADQGLFITLAIFVVVGFFRGWIIPGPIHRAIVAFHKLRGDEYMAASSKKDETIDKLANSNSIVDHFFQEVPVQDIEKTLPRAPRLGEKT